MNCGGCEVCWRVVGDSEGNDDFDDAVTMPYMKLVDGKFINTDTQEIDVDDVEFV